MNHALAIVGIVVLAVIVVGVVVIVSFLSNPDNYR